MRSHALVKFLLVLLFYILLIIDNIYGYLYYQAGINAPIAVIYRAFVLILVLFVLRKLYSVFSLFSLFFIICIFKWSLLDNAAPIPEFLMYIRLIYIPILILFFCYCSKRMDRQCLYKFIVDYSLIISLVIVFCFLTVIGNYSYGGGD